MSKLHYANNFELWCTQFHDWTSHGYMPTKVKCILPQHKPTFMLHTRAFIQSQYHIYALAMFVSAFQKLSAFNSVSIPCLYGIKVYCEKNSINRCWKGSLMTKFYEFQILMTKSFQNPIFVLLIHMNSFVDFSFCWETI